jgi:hypothetical protein
MGLELRDRVALVPVPRLTFGRGGVDDTKLAYEMKGVNEKIQLLAHSTQLLAHYFGPGMDHYRCDLVFVSKTQATRYSHTVAHYPDPLFHSVLPAPPPATSAAHPLHPNPTSDGSDLLGKSFLDDELGLCTVSSLADPILLQAGTGNLTPGLRLVPGYPHALTYFDPTSATHTSSVPELAHWVCNFPLPVPAPTEPFSDLSVPSAPVPFPFRAEPFPSPLSPNFPSTVPSAILVAFFWDLVVCSSFLARCCRAPVPHGTPSFSTPSRPLQRVLTP